MTGTRSAEIGVVIVHGMGCPDRAFAAPLIDGLTRSMGDDAAAVAYEPCFWSDILQVSQDAVWRRLERSPAPMHLHALREWVIGTLGDPTGYLAGYQRRPSTVTQLVHQRFAESLSATGRRLNDPTGAPIVVLAHSLGGVVVTNYLWNLERAAGELRAGGTSTMYGGAREAARRPVGDTPAERLETLAGLVTFGCSIPLFLPPTPPYECVRFPRATLPARLRPAARWLNVYDPFDILGYPLSNLWDETHGTAIHDVALDVGMPGISMTPLSHAHYWADAGFHTLVAGELRRVLHAARLVARDD